MFCVLHLLVQLTKYIDYRVAVDPVRVSQISANEQINETTPITSWQQGVHPVGKQGFVFEGVVLCCISEDHCHTRFSLNYIWDR